MENTIAVEKRRGSENGHMILFIAKAGRIVEFHDKRASAVIPHCVLSRSAPVNEIFVAARNSGLDGIWNEHLLTERGFVTALKHLVAANLLATAAISRHRPNAVIITSASRLRTKSNCATNSSSSRSTCTTRKLLMQMCRCSSRTTE